MANYIVDRKQFAIAKEAVRGTAEAAPSRYLWANRDSSLDFSLEHVANDHIANQVAGDFTPDAGRKVGKGKISMNLEAQTIGEHLYSLLGTYTGAQDGTTTAYTHTFTKTTSTQHKSYTLFVDRGVDYFRYNLGVCKSLEFSLDAKGKGKVAAEWLFKNEATAASFSPTLAASDPLMFYHADVEVDNSSIGSRVAGLNLKIENQATPIWLYDQSQLCNDIVVAKKLQCEGGFDMYFTAVSERDDFLANTSRKLEFNITGDTIVGSSKFRMLISMYACKYTAVPFDGELEGGLLGASVAFKAFYSISDSKMLDIIIGNATTTY